MNRPIPVEILVPFDKKDELEKLLQALEAHGKNVVEELWPELEKLLYDYKVRKPLDLNTRDPFADKI